MTDKPTIEITIRVIGSDIYAVGQVLHAVGQNLAKSTHAEGQKLDFDQKNGHQNHAGLNPLDLKVGDRVIIAKLDECLKVRPFLPMDFQCQELIVKKINGSQAYCRLPDKRGYWLDIAWLEQIEKEIVTKN